LVSDRCSWRGRCLQADLELRSQEATWRPPLPAAETRNEGETTWADKGRRRQPRGGDEQRGHGDTTETKTSKGDGQDEASTAPRVGKHERLLTTAESETTAATKEGARCKHCQGFLLLGAECLGTAEEESGLYYLLVWYTRVEVLSLQNTLYLVVTTTSEKLREME
jgi:hypothetical protein